MAEGTWHTVRQGDSVESVAAEYGHFWQTLWNDPANAQLQQLRGDPNVLLAGDSLFVPPLRPKEERVPSGRRHRFRRHGVPSFIHLVLRSGGEPIADVPYALKVGERIYRGRTQADGVVRQAVDPRVKTVRLQVGDGAYAAVFELQPRCLDPLSTVSGVQGRLQALGLFGGEPDGNLDEPTRGAVRRFQEKHGLPPTGDIDDATRAAVQKAYAGS